MPSERMISRDNMPVGDEHRLTRMTPKKPEAWFTVPFPRASTMHDAMESLSKRVAYSIRSKLHLCTKSSEVIETSYQVECAPSVSLGVPFDTTCSSRAGTAKERESSNPINLPSVAPYVSGRFVVKALEILQESLPRSG